MLHKFFKYLFKNQILLALFLIIIGWFILEVRNILISVFLAYIIMAAFLPFVEYLEKNKIPKIIGAIFIYLWAILIVYTLILPLVPLILMQGRLLIAKFPFYLFQAGASLGIRIDMSHAQQIATNQINSFSENAFGITSEVFDSFLSVFTIFIISFYMLLYHESTNQFIAGVFHPDYRPRVIKALDRINHKLGAWLRGQILLSIAVGVMSWIALTLLNVPFSLSLAILSGFLEGVPTLGPILSAIPAVIVAFNISTSMAITVIIAYVIIQLIENNLLVPNIMRKAVGLNPVVVILAIMTGVSLMGLVGALLAIPLISFIIVVYRSINSDI